MRIRIQITEDERKILNGEVERNFEDRFGDQSVAAQSCEAGFMRALQDALRAANERWEALEATDPTPLSGAHVFEASDVSVQLTTDGTKAIA